MTTSPFKFLDSYAKEDISTFFGRERETGELFRLCFTSPILVVYGGSGTGKTSLVQCGLQSKFNESDWLPVMVRRSGDMLTSLKEAIAANTLTPSKSADISEQVSNLYLDHFKPVWFIFDQFEELFIFGRREEGEAFFSAIRALLEKERNAHVIFIVREEYLAELTRFEEIIPELIENRFRVERMQRGRAVEVVEKLCASKGITCAPGFSEAMVDRLNSEGQGVELSYLQVYLDRCWRSRTNDEAFSTQLLERIGYVDDLLGAFLDEQVADTPDPQRSESLLKAFVSDQGTKRQLTSDEAHEWVNAIGTAMEPDEVDRLLQIFVAKRLLKDRDERGRYELLHDALARQIFKRITRAEQELIEVRQFVQQAHGQYQKRGVKLTKNDLNYLRPYRAQLHLKGDIAVFVEDAFGEELRKARRQKRTRVFLALAALLGFVALGLFAGSKINELKVERRQGESHQRAERAMSLLDKDPMQALAYARTSFLLDSNEASIKALTAAYDRGYNEIARYEGNVVLWPPSMNYYLIGYDRSGTINIYDRSFQLIATVDSMIIDDRCKFVADSLIVCPTQDHHMVVIGIHGEVLKSLPYKNDGWVFDPQTDIHGRSYFGLQADSGLYLFTSTLDTIARFDVKQLGFGTNEISYNWRFRLWDDEWCFVTSARGITFHRFNSFGGLFRERYLKVRDKPPDAASKRGHGDGSISILRVGNSFQFYDEDGLFEVVRDASQFNIHHLLKNDGFDKSVDLSWERSGKTPVFFSKKDGGGRVTETVYGKRSEDPDGIFRWLNDEGKVMTTFGDPKTIRYDAVAGPFVLLTYKNESSVWELVGAHHQEARYVKYGMSTTFMCRVGNMYACMGWQAGGMLIELLDGRDLRSVRSARIHAEASGRGLRSIGNGYMALKTSGSVNSIGEYIILDSLLSVITVLPAMDDMRFASIRVHDATTGADHDEILVSTPKGIARVGQSRSMISGPYTIPAQRVGVLNDALPNGVWRGDAVDSLSVFERQGHIYCRNWHTGSIDVLELKGDSFVMQHKFPIATNGHGAPALAWCVGEEAQWGMMAGEEYWLLDGDRSWKMDLPKARSQLGEAHLDRSGSVIYQLAPDVSRLDTIYRRHGAADTLVVRNAQSELLRPDLINALNQAMDRAMAKHDSLNGSEQRGKERNKPGPSGLIDSRKASKAAEAWAKVDSLVKAERAANGDERSDTVVAIDPHDDQAFDTAVVTSPEYQLTCGGIGRWDTTGSVLFMDSLRFDSLIHRMPPLVYRSRARVLELDQRGNVHRMLKADILQRHSKDDGYRIFPRGMDDLVIATDHINGWDDRIEVEVATVNGTTGAVQCQWKGTGIGLGDVVLSGDGRGLFAIGGEKNRDWVVGGEQQIGKSGMACLIMDLTDCTTDTVEIDDPLLEHLTSIDSRSVLLTKPELRGVTDDGFAVIADGRLGAQHDGYAFPLGNGMILTSHRFKQKFERYPVLPSSILHMIEKEKVYGDSYAHMTPIPEDLQPGHYFISWALFGKGLLVLLLSGLVVRWLWNKGAKPG